LPTLPVAVAQRTSHQNAITAPSFQAQAKQMIRFMYRRTAGLISCSGNTVFNCNLGASYYLTMFMDCCTAG